jgi:hypothetical protein
MPWVAIGLSFYAFNVAVGLMAQFGGRRFGAWHHVLYAAVCATTLAAAVLSFHPALLVTLAALAIFPRARPRSALHPILAVVGGLGYGLTVLTDF